VLVRIAGNLVVRVGAFACGVISVLCGTWVSLLALIYSSALRLPDPDPALDGDPCCGYPDTWSEVVLGGTYAVATGIAALGLITAGGLLIWSAMINGLPPRVRGSRLLRAGGVLAVACGAAVPLSWVLWTD
jgi:hypothetical protein